MSSLEPPHTKIGPFYWAFDKMYPLIRFTYENMFGHPWFTQIMPQLWLGGAPTYQRDYDYLLANNINAVINIRAERSDWLEFYDQHDITYVHYKVWDTRIPDGTIMDAAVSWTKNQIEAGRTVLIHCAKGRGRSATLLAAYLMAEQGMDFEQANGLMKSKRPLTKLESRHQKVLEAWIASKQS
ncbi:dual specificity protein phosphatase [Anaerolineales bacterium HSG25]|nr:dual specificity protein phosphatase [Anaerolineales bacterium HSG25]